MQDISLDYLAKRARDHPQYAAPVDYLVAGEHRFQQEGSCTMLNMWSNAKFALFPTGGWFWAAILLFGISFSWGFRRKGFSREISIVGLVATAGCLADMFVALLGDGRYELIKHLFLANILFDLGVLALLCLTLVYFQNRTQR
jgi:hypothetical protein